MALPVRRELADWVAATVGAPRSILPCGWPQGPSRVWRVRGGDGSLLYLKEFAEERAREQELAAYDHWLPRLRGGGVRLPEVVARSDPGLRALILSEVPGEVAGGLPLDDEQGIEVHRAAGAFLRRLHELPIEDDDPMPLSEAIPLRLALWLERGGDRLSFAEGRIARSLVGDGAVFEGDRRVPCHRDYQLRNWILDRRDRPASLGVIDFEHARLDHPLVDWVRVRERALPRYPRWVDAFAEGYGTPLDEALEPRLHALDAVHAIGSVVWGAEHGDVEFERAGHALLERLRSVLS